MNAEKKVSEMKDKNSIDLETYNSKINKNTENQNNS